MKETPQKPPTKTPFYVPVYEQALAHLEAGESLGSDSRGANILRHIRARVGETGCTTAIDLGCGLGETAIALASKYKSVLATDISRNALKSLKKLVERNKIDNIYPVLLDASNLPFKDNSFDLIICNGVMEWVSINCPSNVSPEAVQISMLKEVRRVSSLSGLFWLGIENRFALKYFLGVIDHHSELRFITFLPRILANYYSKLAKKHPYRNYLYTYWELLKILLNQGFKVKKFLTAFPDYWNPEEVADISNTKELLKIANLPQSRLPARTRSVIKVISKLHLTKLVIHDFIILCFKRNELNKKNHCSPA